MVSGSKTCVFCLGNAAAFRWTEPASQSSANDFNKLFFNTGFVNAQILSNSNFFSASVKSNCVFAVPGVCFDKT